MSLEACLPAHLRRPDTTITSIGDGLSGAGVYRVETGGQAFVLKVAAESEPLDAWRRRVRVQQLAADARLAPAVIHVDEERRAVVSAFVPGGGAFLGLLANPATRGAAIELLGRTVRRVHALPVPEDAEPADPLKHLATTWATLDGGVAVPGFVAEAVERVLAEPAPAADRPRVLSHNDIHPANLVHDGENLLLVDWDAAAPNDLFYDLAAISIFLRMDEGSCRTLLSAYEGEPVNEIPARFSYLRRVVGVQCGATFLSFALLRGHAGASGETVESAPSLAEFYQQMRSGALSLMSAEGQWCFALALVKEGVSAEVSPL